MEVSAGRLDGWFTRFADGHGGADRTEIAADRVEVHAQDGARAAVHVPFGSLEHTGTYQGLDVAPLVEHLHRPRRIGLILVRLGAHSVGVVEGGRVTQSSTDRHLVHGRNKAGGWSQQRFARRREGQSRRALDRAADAVAEFLLPQRSQLDGVVLGGDRKALESLRGDARLKELLDGAEARVLDVPEPRRSVLDAAAKRVTAVEVEVRDQPV